MTPQASKAADRLRVDRDLDRSFDLVQKSYNPKQPRWPEGIPGIGGQWKPADAPIALNGLIQKVFEGIGEKDPAVPAAAKAIKDAAEKTQWKKTDSVADALTKMKRVLEAGRDSAEKRGSLKLSKRLGDSIGRIEAATTKVNMAGERALAPEHPNAAEHVLGDRLIPQSTQTKDFEPGQSGPEELVSAKDLQAGDVVAGRFGAKDRRIEAVASDSRGVNVGYAGMANARSFHGRNDQIRIRPRKEPSGPFPSKPPTIRTNRKKETSQLDEYADRLRYGTAEWQEPAEDLPIPEIEEPIDLSTRDNIFTSGENPLYRLETTPEYRLAFFQARNKLANGRDFNDLSPEQADALEATLDKNVLGMPVTSTKAAMLRRIAHDLRVQRGEKPAPGVPEIDFSEKKGISLADMSKQDLINLAKHYGISTKGKTKRELIGDIEWWNMPYQSSMSWMDQQAWGDDW